MIEALLEHTNLIDIAYLIKLAETGGTVPRCQDVPENVKIGKHNMWRLMSWPEQYSLPVLVLSYPWLDRAHPDRLGAQLVQMLPILKLFFERAKSKGSKHGTVGVFMDYPCLPQKPFRTPAEKEGFDHGLASLNEWYKHKYTHVLLVDGKLPSDAEYTNKRPYSKRGWCKFEYCISGLVKASGHLLSMSQYCGAAEFEDMKDEMQAKRLPPVCPVTFADEMRAGVASGDLGFTAQADMEMVIEKYRKGFISAFDDTLGLNIITYQDLSWGDEELEVLVQACRYASAHCQFPAGEITINIHANPISEGMRNTLTDRRRFGDEYGSIALELSGKFKFVGPDWVPPRLDV